MAIDLRDYSRTAAQRGWGAGWPTCDGAKSAGTAVVTADRSGTRLSVHRRIARLVDLLLDETERRGYLLRPGQCGGYNCRPIRDTSIPSNHSWALAVDINWADNPLTTSGQHQVPSWMPGLWNRYGFAWGGQYSAALKDYMHWEFMGTPADADAVTALAIKELADIGVARVLRLTDPPMRGDDVRNVQRVLVAWYPSLKLAVDGVYGSATAAAVSELQRRSGLDVDGAVGPLTLAVLGLGG